MIPKYKESLEDTVIASLQGEVEIKNTLCNAVRELPVTLDEIRRQASDKKFIKYIILRIKHKNQQKTDIYSICNNILKNGERAGIISI